ncbi:MAG: hypothetical protein WEE89_20385 [Gemmatimonadota bacterium]
MERRDSAGIVVIETPGALARAPIGWNVGTLPELQLGGAAGKEAEEFHRIGGRFGGGIKGLADGRFVVVNAGSGELLFFGREGSFLNRLSIKGDGPGEFRIPIFVHYASNDSLLIRNTGHDRYTLFSNDGQTHRSFLPPDMPPGLITGEVGGASASGIVTRLASDGGGVQWFEGQIMRPIDVRWINLESRRVETVAQFSSHAFGVRNFDGNPYYEFRVPFTTHSSAAVGVRGFFVTGGDRPEVRAFDNSGRLIRIFRVMEVPRRVTLEDRAGAIDTLVGRFPKERSKVRWVYERMDIPTRWPTFQSVRVDRLGWIWVELFRPPHHLTPQWMVFDSSGVARGVVDLPRGLEVQDIGPDYVLGRWLDDLRVEYVRRYRLDRNR